MRCEQRCPDVGHHSSPARRGSSPSEAYGRKERGRGEGHEPRSDLLNASGFSRCVLRSRKLMGRSKGLACCAAQLHSAGAALRQERQRCVEAERRAEQVRQRHPGPAPAPTQPSHYSTTVPPYDAFYQNGLPFSADSLFSPSGLIQIKGKSVMQDTAQQRSPDLSPLVTVVPHRHPAPTSGTHLSLQAHPEFPVTPAPLSLQHPCSLFPVTVPHVLLHPSASLLPPFGLGLQQYMFLLSLPPPSPSLPRPGSAPPRHFLTWRISGQQCARACTLTRDPRGPRILLLSTV